MDEEVEQIIHGRENAGRGTVLVDDGAGKKKEENATGGEYKGTVTEGKEDESGKNDGKNILNKRDRDMM